jgi:hypothetical protein
VSPGQTISFTVQVTAPISAGNGLYVEYQLVSENQFWFRQFSDQHVNVAQAGYDISQAPSSWQAGQTQTYTVTLINTGQWTWPAGGSNPVRLGVHFTTQPGGERMNFPDWLSDQRYSLPSDVVPGQRLPLTISVTAPLDAAGTVTVEYQLVKEGQFWFGDYADQQVTMADGSYSVGNTPATWAAGQAATYAVTLTNSGTWTWPAGGSNPVRLGVHFTTQAGGEATNFASWLSDQRFSLPSDLAPSQSVTFNIAVVAPVNASGNLTLEYQLVKEGQFWFQAFADVSVTVSEATYATASAPSTLVSGQQSGVFQVTLTNTGAWTWPAGGSNPVRLGVHLAGAGGGEAVNVSQWLTDQRFNLPADVAPGQSVSLNISVTPPPRAGGSLVLEYQLVKEGAFWFASFSDQSVTVTQVSYNVTATPTAWTKGQFQTYQVTVTNTGGWTWPAAGNNPVHLGIHFTTAGGGEAVDYASWLTDQRFVLPADVPPGGSATITVYVSAPNNSGSMFIEYQMVSENQFWFGQFQDVSVTVS